MASAYKIGTEVKQIVVPVQGVIQERAIAGDDDIYLVKWTEEDGDEMTRWFKEDEIAPVEG